MEDLRHRVESIAARLAASGPETPPLPPSSPTSGPYHQAACVLTSFDPTTLRPLPRTDAPETEKDQLLADSVHLTAEGQESRWTLSPGPRIDALRTLRETGRLNEAIKVTSDRPQHPAQGILDALLTGDPPPIEKQSLAQLAATYEVSGWLREAGFENLPDTAAVRRRIEWLTLLEPFEHLAGRHFEGRHEELAVLREFVGVMPPGSRRDSLKRAVARILSLKEKPPLLIYGPGGVGKSTLIARFILDHAKEFEHDRFPFAYLDFDRPEISALEPLSILVETVRQLGVGYPTIRESCEHIRGRWLDIIAQSRASNQNVGSTLANSNLDRSLWQGGDSTESMLTDLASLVNALGAADRPMLLVLDTFEEVQLLGQEHVDAIWRLLDRLQGVVPRLRVVLAGRAEIARHVTKDLVLTGLDSGAAMGYLQARGVTDDALARRVVDHVGTSPLSLKFAAELLQKEGATFIEELDRGTNKRLQDALIQRWLYNRVLGHIKTEDVQKLAHPGLILRRITPELILEVLNGPCRLGIASLARAAEIFELMKKEITLVRTAPDGALVHRQDLRVLMVELLHADKPAESKEIHERAVAYYERHEPRPEWRAEEIYHRLWLNQPPSQIDSRWLPGVERYLHSALAERGGERHAYLASRLGVDMDDDAVKALNLENWERVVERRVRAYLQHGQVDQALTLLASRRERSDASPLVGLEVTALARSGQDSEALERLLREIDRTGENLSRAAELALQAADICLAAANTTRAKEVAEALARLSDHGTQADRLAINARRLALLRLGGGSREEAAPLKEQVGALLDAVRDDELRSTADLGRWAGAWLDKDDERSRLRIARLMRVSGLGRRSREAVGHLAAHLTALDVAVSDKQGKPPGHMARELRVPPRDTVTATWSDFLLAAPDGVLNEALERVFSQYATVIPASLVSAVTDVLWASLGFESMPTPAVTRAAAGNVPEPAFNWFRRGRRPIPGSLLKLVETGLRESFDFKELREFVHSRLNRSPDAIAPGGDFEHMISALVTVATNEKWLGVLVARARQARPGNEAFARAAEQLGQSSLPSEEEVGDAGFLFGVEDWREKMGRIEGQICRVEAGKASCTGFLVAVDLVLIAEFTLDPSAYDSATPPEVSFRFDYKADRDGHTVTQGTVFELHRDWLAARSAWGSSPRGLGYALLRLRNSPGAQPIGGSNVESMASLRRWIEVGKPPDVAAGSPLVMLQHPEGRPLQATFGERACLGFNSDRSRIYYDLDTKPGAAGAPCFTPMLEVVAFHVGNAGPEDQVRSGARVGVPMAAVRDDLERRNLGALISARFA